MAHRVAIVVYDELCAFEFGTALEIFGLPRPELDIEWYETEVVSAGRRPVSLLGGCELRAPSLDRVDGDFDTVVIPGWPRSRPEPPKKLLSFVQRALERGTRIVSLCAGAFVLAHAGLLDGLQATTHWQLCNDLAACHPAVEVVPNVLFTDSGQILTSAGSAACIDLGLHIIEQDHGAAIAANVARRLVAQPKRHGDQAQFTQALHVVVDRGAIAEVMEWAIANLASDLTVRTLAEQASMSPRNFARRFVAETATTPMAWVLEQRLHHARRLLETTELSIEHVARRSGLSTPETLRHHFRSKLSTTPTAYRRAFSLT